MQSSSMLANMHSTAQRNSVLQAISKLEWFGFLCFAIVSCALLFISLDSNWRQALHTQFHPPYRTVLSKASGDFLKTGVWLDILKIQSDEGLFVEVYASGPKEAPRLVDRLRLSGNKDAYFHSRSQATRLVVEDIDGGGPSIIVPSFDDDLVAHVNVFRILENGQTQQVADNR